MPEAIALSIPIEDLPAYTGRAYGPSSWLEVRQQDVDDFARVTGDRNPIHVDPEAAAATPFGGTIAHGLLTHSLVVPLMAEVFEVTGASMGINYGLNRLRFPAPVPVGSRIRVSGVVDAVDEVAGGYQIATTVTWEREGGEKPVCVAEMLLRYLR
ncbi:MaoC family dehydratase [Leucobacter allii]|uniref:MaoC family dehydratase n=1 Tax=Leucobacter allii TaxID=2932247 RepID=A0ABY4FM58_9MICO|nr:MaoC family dehydratase [Leucobacter allii]UOQ57369.1 MaoC family dehydratase [Leucobacter allii]